MSRQVLYDFEMVEALSKRLVDVLLGKPQVAWSARFETVDADTRRTWFETNAMLEGVVIHGRALVDFLWDQPPKPQGVEARRKRGKATHEHDVFALQFFDIADTWRSSRGRGKRPPELAPDALSARVGREVAHVTAHRVAFTDGGPAWSPYAIYSALAPVMERFALLVPSDRVCADFPARVNAAMPQRQPRSQALRPRPSDNALPPRDYAALTDMSLPAAHTVSVPTQTYRPTHD